MSNPKDTEIKKIQRKPIINLKFVNLLIFAAVMFSCAYYLAGMNELSTKGFELRKTRKTLSAVQSEKDKLELEIMALESYNNLHDKVGGLGMVKVDKMDFVSGADGIVAKK